MHITYKYEPEICTFNASCIKTSFLEIGCISSGESLHKLSTSYLHFYAINRIRKLEHFSYRCKHACSEKVYNDDNHPNKGKEGDWFYNQNGFHIKSTHLQCDFVVYSSRSSNDIPKLLLLMGIESILSI